MPETPPSTPPQKRLGRARILSPEQQQDLREDLMAANRKRLNETHVFAPEDLARMRDEAAKRQALPREAPKEQSADTEKEQKRSRIVHLLKQSTQDLREDIKIANANLVDVQRHPMFERLTMGKRHGTGSSAEEIARLEQRILELSAEAEHLSRAQKTFSHDGTISPEAFASLRALEGRIASDLSRSFEYNQQHASHPVSLDTLKQKLSAISSTLNDLSS
jgi:hypothetical protein